MPEQLTRHPDVTLEVLKSAGARCGAGAPQKILKQCPAELAAALPPAAASPPQVSWAEGLAVALVFVAGLLVGAATCRFRRTPSRGPP